jgi:hypothetical protein
VNPNIIKDLGSPTWLVRATTQGSLAPLIQNTDRAKIACHGASHLEDESRTEDHHARIDVDYPFAQVMLVGTCEYIRSRGRWR